MDSLNSEGITFRRPTNAPILVLKETKSSRKRKNDDDEDSDYEEELLSCVSGRLKEDTLRTYEEPRETIPERQKLYEDCVKNLKDIYENVQRKFNQGLQKGFDKFMDSSLQLVSANGDGCVPIGIVESGLSTKENSALFDFLEEQLKLRTEGKSSREQILITRIDSSSSSSTKVIFQKMCAQLVHSILSQKESSSDDEDFQISRIEKKKNLHFSLYDVKSCLKNNGETRFKVVVLVEDVEYFATTIISQLLTLMGCANLPVVFVFGTTHGHFVNNLIPSHSPSQFVIEKIYSVSAQGQFQEFMRRAIFNTLSPFRVSGEIISFLESLYKEENFSIQHICNSLMICLRSHFLTAKSAFCSWKKSAEYPKLEKEGLLKLLKAEDAEKSPRKRMKISDFDIDGFIDTSLENLQNWLFMFRVVCFINLRVEHPLGDSYCQVYTSCCQGMKDSKPLNVDDNFEKFFRALKDASKSVFSEILEDCITFLKENKNFSEVSLKNQVAANFQEILNEMEEKENQEQCDGGTSQSLQTNMKFRIPKTKTKNKLKEIQEAILKSKSETQSALQKGKSKFVKYLEELLKKYLPPLSELQFSKAFVFTDLNFLVNTISPANFLKLDEDLKNPGLSLQCDCCSSLDSTSIDINLPDVSILHKLISEHTTKIVELNLVYRSFLGIVEQKQRRSKTGKDAAEASYLKRFRRGIGELQHMGFVKRSKTKPDEVTRLTWW